MPQWKADEQLMSVKVSVPQGVADLRKKNDFNLWNPLYFSFHQILKKQHKTHTLLSISALNADLIYRSGPILRPYDKTQQAWHSRVGACGLWKIQEVLKVFLKANTQGEGDDPHDGGLTGFIRWAWWNRQNNKHSPYTGDPEIERIPSLTSFL